jgi:hypothetical protein
MNLAKSIANELRSIMHRKLERQIFPKNQLRRQRGAALLLLILIISIATLGTLYAKIDSESIKIERDKKTADALKSAKEALIAYSIRDLSPGTCTTNCPRPGDLPCPDTNNDGNAETGCGNASGSSQQANRIGRLPWKTLGLDDLRDGYGERLWYAVSNSYKYNTRSRPLNSDTLGTITVRDSAGRVIYDGSSSTGVAAVVFSAGPAITREDGIQQDRSASQENSASNYLDIANGEDNSNFVDSTTNGFIVGPVNNSDGNEILNDRLLLVTRDEMITVMESRVLLEVRDALSVYYAANGFYPNPATFSDTTCLGNNNLSACNASVSTNHGRIPANGITPAWNSTSIFQGTRNGHWFQQNNWRELIHYAVAPACITGTVSCTGSGYLTLNNALVLPDNQKQVVVISAGRTLTGQSRTDNASQTSEANYMEGENLSPLDNIYSRSTAISDSFNDRAASIP